MARTLDRHKDGLWDKSENKIADGLRLRCAPERIVCLTEEPTEILYALGESERIVGISAFTVRPPEALEEKPVVSAFIGGSVEKIAALKPDLIIGFSDIQADLARDLIKANLPVLIFNQRSVQEILDVVLTVANLVGAQDRGIELVESYLARLRAIEDKARCMKRRPRVYFEEWDEPLISAIEWVGQLIEIAGGDHVFSDRASGKLAKERFVSHEEVIAKNPEVMLFSWCGKKVDLDSVRARPGYDGIDAVQSGRMVEFDPAIILQPGPAALTDGVEALFEVICRSVDDGDK